MKPLSVVLATLMLFCASHALAAATAKPSAAELATGKQVYDKSCLGCHAAGVMGAPKTGDKAAWKAHLGHGTAHMVDNAIKGVGRMPAKGGNTKLTDAEVKAAVLYMIEQSK